MINFFINLLPASITGLHPTPRTGHNHTPSDPLKVNLAIPTLSNPGHGQLLLHPLPGPTHDLLILFAGKRDVDGKLAVPAGVHTTLRVKTPHNLVL